MLRRFVIYFINSFSRLFIILKIVESNSSNDAMYLPNVVHMIGYCLQVTAMIFLHFLHTHINNNKK